MVDFCQVTDQQREVNYETSPNSSVDIEELDEVSAAHRGPDGGGGLMQQPGDPNRPQTDLTSLLLDQFLTPIDKDVTAAAASSNEAAAASQLNASILSQTSNAVSEPVKNLNETSAASSSDYGNRSRLVRASFATKNVQGCKSFERKYANFASKERTTGGHT